MKLSLGLLPAYVINLDRSRDRWIRFARDFRTFFPRMEPQRVSGVDGREFIDPNKGSETQGWKLNVLSRLQREGLAGKEHILDPVRTALCLSHQRALRSFLDAHDSSPTSPSSWALFFEDDARPGEALAAFSDDEIEITIPSDAEALFLHDRVWKRGQSSKDDLPESRVWRIVRGGIGLEAYAVNVFGARKMLSAFRPVIEECDIQLMTFMEGFADLEQKEQIWSALRDEGHSAFPAIRAYAPLRPLFQTDHWMPSVKFETMREASDNFSD